ncbi:hypothetical protein ABZ297_11395 [Nonomuraea sp. NPDC005983]|uniref:hypothetical protein n=1 Tax=Nonomuraea sp. NPDC005983 TaxID=3155595 RepID=UPI0033AD573F
MEIESLFMLIMGVLVAAAVAIWPAAMALKGIKQGEWPVLRRRLVVYRGFIVR